MARTREARPDGGKWIVVLHLEAVVDLEGLKDRHARKAVLTIAGVLEHGGPTLTEPHSKSIKGAPKLRELRPGGGRVAVRPIYAQTDARTFTILAIGPEAIVDPRGFANTVDRARRRARETYGLDL